MIRRHITRSYLWLIPIVLILTIALSGCRRGSPASSGPPPTPTPYVLGGPGLITHQVVVEIVSGTLEGNTYAGAFSYDPTPLINRGGEELFVTEAAFCYLDILFKEDTMDPFPRVQFIDGEFVRLVATGGDLANRFGLNAGYNSQQFTRDSEAFVFNGEDFFGYMNDGRTAIDGAGRISYIQLEPNEAFVMPSCGTGETADQ